MTISSSIDHDNLYMKVSASGLISWDEVRSHLFAERLEKGLSYRELIDARTATPDWSLKEAREIATLLTTFRSQSALGPTAVVVSGDLAYGMMRMLEILLSDVCMVKPFRDYDEAEKWIKSSKATTYEMRDER